MPVTNRRCPVCLGIIWPWQHWLRLGWDFKYIRRQHTACVIARGAR